MATKKSIWVLFGILVISAWVLGSVIEARAETMKCRTAHMSTKRDTMPVPDEEGHVLGLSITEGLSFFENGEIAKMASYVALDSVPQKGNQSMGYTFYTFGDGSTIVVRFQRVMVPDTSGNFSAKTTTEITKGTGRFGGIKGTTSSTGKAFPGSKGEAYRYTDDVTFTYTLPPK